MESEAMRFAFPFLKEKEMLIINVIPQVRTITRNGTESVILFDYAESPQ